MTNETELMPCPFCRGKARHDVNWLDSFTKENGIGCSSCDAWLPEASPKDWNARAVPEGYALVPLEPTEAMMKEPIADFGQTIGKRSIYKSMIAAAQKGGE